MNAAAALLIALSILLQPVSAPAPIPLRQPEPLVQSLSPIIFSAAAPYNATGISQALNVTYAFYPNGTAQASSGQARFRLGSPAIGPLPIAGLLTLWSNSSMFQYRYSAGIARATLNYTRIRGSYGINLTAAGAGIGPNPFTNTTLSLSLAGSFSPTAIVNRTSSLALGGIAFDWSDTLRFKPTYNTTSMVLKWTIPSFFKFDPTITFNNACSGGGTGASSYLSNGFQTFISRTLVVTVAILMTSVSVSTITDTRGNSFTFRLAVNNGASVRDELWTARPIGAANPDTINVTLTGTSSAELACAQYTSVTGFGNTGSNTGNIKPSIQPGGVTVSLSVSSSWVAGNIAIIDQTTITSDVSDCPTTQTRITGSQAGGPSNGQGDNGGGDPAGPTEICWFSGAGTHAYAALGIELQSLVIHPSTMAVSCFSDVLAWNQPSTCTATVTDVFATPTTPTGTVTWTGFTPSCTLSGSGASASCSNKLGLGNAGFVTSLQGFYHGDPTHNFVTKTITFHSSGGLYGLWLLIIAIAFLICFIAYKINGGEGGLGLFAKKQRRRLSW